MAAKPRAAPPLLLTVQQAATALGVSDDTVYRYIADGDLDTTDVARKGSRRAKTRVPLASIEKFIQRRTSNAKKPLRTAS